MHKIGTENKQAIKSPSPNIFTDFIIKEMAFVTPETTV
jgi:hypothetical protein